MYALQIQLLEILTDHLLDLQTSLKLELSLLLQRYKEIFAKPHGLPPLKAHDHNIPLLANTSLLKVRLYCYPHTQKIEIEKIVTNMLSEGIIQPSSSLFSSSVLLVKKKDGTWHFLYRLLDP